MGKIRKFLIPLITLFGVTLVVSKNKIKKKLDKNKPFEHIKKYFDINEDNLFI
tara:strand:- start:719 stop:877 length:159 start_codon:yes stop_codon:yes gene_type:complete